MDNLNKKLEVRSSGFKNNSLIPSKYTCDGEDINPSLRVFEISNKAKSLVLIMEDFDVPKELKKDGIWDHWIKFNIPVTDSEFLIEEGVEPAGVPGLGTSGNFDYHGPCPPDGKHRYFFHIYSLDVILDLLKGSTKKEIKEAMTGHILQEGVLIGLYQRT